MAGGRAFFSILLFFFHPPFFFSLFQTLGSIGHWRFVSFRFTTARWRRLASSLQSGAGVGLAGQGRAGQGKSGVLFFFLLLLFSFL